MLWGYLDVECNASCGCAAPIQESGLPFITDRDGGGRFGLVMSKIAPSTAAKRERYNWLPTLIGEVAVVHEYVEPLGPRILVRKDENRHETRGGIVLPDRAEIPTITGRVVEVSAEVADDDYFPVRKYDKVLFHPKNAIPVDFEPDNLLFVVPMEDVVAVFRRGGKPPGMATEEDEAEETGKAPRGTELDGDDLNGDDLDSDDFDISPETLDDEDAN